MSTNFLNNTSFVFTINRLPETSFMVQSVSLPSLQSSPVLRPTPFITTPLPGDHVDFSPLSITFAVDENMTNYREIYDWMIGLYFPDNHSQYATLSNVKPGSTGTMSDMNLNILTSARNTNVSINFYDAFPVSMSELNMAYNVGDTEIITSSVQFYFRKFEFVS